MKEALSAKLQTENLFLLKIKLNKTKPAQTRNVTTFIRISGPIAEVDKNLQSSMIGKILHIWKNLSKTRRW